MLDRKRKFARKMKKKSDSKTDDSPIFFEWIPVSQIFDTLISTGQRKLWNAISPQIVGSSEVDSDEDME